MLKRCVLCNRVALWFLFYSRFMGMYTWSPDVCKRCANDIAYPAIRDALKKAGQ